MIEYGYIREIYLWWFCVFVGLLDIMTTWFGLNAGFEEKNPVGQFILGEIGFVSLIFFKMAIIILCLLLAKYALKGITDAKWQYMPPTLLSFVWLIAFSINSVQLL